MPKDPTIAIRDCLAEIAILPEIETRTTLQALRMTRRVAKQVAGLERDRERDALEWIESVSEFDADAAR